MKTLHHRGQQRTRPDPRHFERMPCLFAQQKREGELGAAIAFAERVDGVIVGQDRSGQMAAVQQSEPRASMSRSAPTHQRPAADPVLQNKAALVTGGILKNVVRR
jgi:hypothetical protein